MAVIRNVVVRIAADISQLQKSLKEAQNTMASVGKKLASAGKTVSAALTLPIAGMGAAMLKAGADFEEGMSGIKAVSGATVGEMQQLEALALKMGAETKYSAKEAAKGIEELIKAGVSVKDIVGGGLQGALSLAAAGELELADAAEIASTALNSFKADGISVSQAADILAGAANASATSVQEMKYSLAACAAVASSVGMSFKDTSAALAVFAQNGLKGSDAGTSLKTMLMNLQPSTDKQAKLFKELGLMTKEGTSAFFDAQGHIKSMAEIAGLLREKLKGLTDAQRLQAMETMFGSDAIRAANILFKEGAEGVNKMQAEIGKVTAAEVAAERMNNLKGSIEQLRGSLETLAITASKAFLPYLKNAADFLTELTNKFMGLNPSIQKTIMAVAACVAAIGPLMMIAGSVASGISALAGVLSFLVSPVGLVIAAIAGLAAIFIVLYNKNEEFRSLVQRVWSSIAAVVGDAVKAISGWWNTYGSGILAAASAVFNGIWTVIRTVFSQLVNSFNVFASYIAPIWEAIKRLISSLGEVFNQLWQLLQPVFEALGAVVATLYGIWAGVWNGIIQALGPFIQAVINAVDIIVNIIGLVIALLRGDWSAAWEFMKNIAYSAWELMKNLFMTIINFVKGFAEGIVSFFKGLWHALVGGSIVPDIVNGVLGWFSNLLSGVTGFASSLVETVTKAFSDIASAISNVVGNAWSWGTNLVSGFADGIKSGIGKVGKAVQGVADKIAGFLGFHSPAEEGPGAYADKWMPNLVSMMKEGLLKGIPELQGALSMALSPDIQVPAVSFKDPQFAPAVNPGTSSPSLTINITGNYIRDEDDVEHIAVLLVRKLKLLGVYA
ncbi:MAG: phage tail tape measure protein [Clostridiales bacterium]|nr:phage tail tape measure protein [Eubacteriales bacterium]MDH7567390.1 phage tail tape measure protein [Clostridiales bacterium]